MSEIAIIGRGAIALAFLATTVTGVAAVIAALGGRSRYRTAAEYGAYLVCTLFGVAATAMIHAFIHQDFSLTYVYQYSDASMPWFYQLAAFWGGQAGSLMFWAAKLSLFMALATLLHRKRDAELVPWVIAVMCSVLFFFTALLLFVSDPFETFSIIDPPGDGRGLNPQLQVFTMVIHPPSLLTGYVAATVPFAFAMAALLSGRVEEDGWLKATRKWTLVCWGFLTIGLILGMLWAYTELGWGGYWAWDPVENAAFIPWLVLTAFLHSAVIQEKRGMLKRWNMFLVLLAWLLTIFGTFLTRSGLIASVHSFAQSDIGDYFLWYLLAMIAVCFGLVAWRWRRLGTENDIESPLSREFAFLFNNWLLLCAAGVVFFGTLFPKLKEMFFGTTATLGEPWFNKMMAPIGLALLALTAVGVVISWRKATARNFKRNFVRPLIFSAVATIALPLIYWFVRLRHLVGADGLQMGAEEFVRATLAAVTIMALIVCFIAWLSRTITAMRSSTSRDWLLVGGLSGLLGVLGLLLVVLLGLRMSDGAVDSEIVRELAYGLLAVFFCAFVTATIFVEFWRGTRVRMSKLGIGPLTALTGLMVRNQRRYGGYIVHLGIAGLMFGFIGNALVIEQKVVMHPGESVALGDYTIKTTDLWIEQDPEKEKFFARVELYDRNGKLVDVLKPGRFFYHASQQPTSEIDIRSTPFEDVYFAVLNYELAGAPGATTSRDVVALTMVINPFVWWVWIGGILMVFGTLICMWPVEQGEATPSSGRRTSRGASSVGIVLLMLAAPVLLLALLEGRALAADDHDHTADAPVLSTGKTLAEQTRETADPALQSVYSRILCECVNCAGQTIAQCKPTCGEGQRDRRRAAELRDSGLSGDAIVEVFRQERGDAAVVAAPTEGFNNLSWMLPVGGALVTAPLIAFAFVHRRRRRGEGESSSGETAETAAGDTPPAAASALQSDDDDHDDEHDEARLEALERALEALD